MPLTSPTVRAAVAVTALLLILQISAVPNDALRRSAITISGGVGRHLKDDGLSTEYPGSWGFCTAPTSCPIYKTSYHCTAGNAVNGCRLYSEGPFPAADCTKQCITKPPPCGTDIVLNSPCDDYSYWCTSGQEQGHCQAGTPFNPNKCDTQCQKKPTPKVCTNQTIINNNKCPNGGDGYYICTVGLEGGPTPETWGCRPKSLGPHYPEDCQVQCLGPSKSAN